MSDEIQLKYFLGVLESGRKIRRWNAFTMATIEINTER